MNTVKKELKEKTRQLMSKREEAVSVENELNTRTNDVENVRSTLASLPYQEGQMETLQKVHITIHLIDFFLLHLNIL